MSQFTLFGVLKGNKPDFHVAMPPEKAKAFYASVVDKFRKAYNVDAVKGISMLPSFILHLLTCLRKFNPTVLWYSVSDLSELFGRWCFWSNDEGASCITNCIDL